MAIPKKNAGKSKYVDYVHAITEIEYVITKSIRINISALTVMEHQTSSHTTLLRQTAQPSRGKYKQETTTPKLEI